MICYALACGRGHTFEAWFRDSDAYAGQVKRKLVECPVCGSTRVAKTLMAPGVGGRGDRDEWARTDAERLGEAVRALRERVEARATDVGRKFPEEARRMHAGEVDAKAIYGEASLAEARALREEGVPCMPLPWSARRAH